MRTSNCSSLRAQIRSAAFAALLYLDRTTFLNARPDLLLITSRHKHPQLLVSPRRKLPPEIVFFRPQSHSTSQKTEVEVESLGACPCLLTTSRSNRLFVRSIIFLPDLDVGIPKYFPSVPLFETYSGFSVNAVAAEPFHINPIQQPKLKRVMVLPHANISVIQFIGKRNRYMTARKTIMRSGILHVQPLPESPVNG